jgi:hypothetical protein
MDTLGDEPEEIIECIEIIRAARETAEEHLTCLEESVIAAVEALRRRRDEQEKEHAEVLRIEGAKSINLARSRRAWEAELACMTAVQPSMVTRIKLNVGGVRFETSRATLLGVTGSMLETMFGARVDMLQYDPDDGSVFLDRDGARFGMILDFLRDGNASLFAKKLRGLPSMRQREEMRSELDFFGLTDAVFPRAWIEDAQFRVWGGRLNDIAIPCAALVHGNNVLVFGRESRYVSYTSPRAVVELLSLDGEDGEVDVRPATVPVRPVLAGRGDICVVRIDDQRAIVIGGSSEVAYEGTGVNTTEILDLSTMLVTPGPSMQRRRFLCSAVALGDGRVIVVGGSSKEYGILKTTEILDTKTMTFAPGPDMLSHRRESSVTVFEKHGRFVLVSGGNGSTLSSSAYVKHDRTMSTTEVLDLSTMKFSHGPVMNVPRRGSGSVFIGEESMGNCVIVIGGYCDHNSVRTRIPAGILNSACSTTEVLDLETMKFTYGPKLLPKEQRTTTVVDESGGRVFVIRGKDDHEVEVLEASVFQGQTRAMRWRQM